LIKGLSKIDNLDISQFRYLDISNIFFTEPLSNNEISSIKEIFLSPNGLNQIYFQGNCNFKTIELIKYLLEISPSMNDGNIEKYILNTDKLNMKELMNLSFSNPKTWYISYLNYDDVYKTTTIDRYRFLETNINGILDMTIKYDSVLEKILCFYDFCKSIDFTDQGSVDLVSILENKKANNIGYCIVFSELLKRIGVSNYIGRAVVDNNDYYVVIALINDLKYKVDGIYLFDPLSDYIDKDEVEDLKLRMINYNFFALCLNDFTNNIFDDKLKGILSCLIHDFEYDSEKIKFESKNDLEKFEKSFDQNFLNIHMLVSNTTPISDETKLSIIESVNESKGNNMQAIIDSNYYCRQKQIFKKRVSVLMLKE